MKVALDKAKYANASRGTWTCELTARREFSKLLGVENDPNFCNISQERGGAINYFKRGIERLCSGISEFEQCLQRFKFTMNEKLPKETSSVERLIPKDVLPLGYADTPVPVYSSEAVED